MEDRYTFVELLPMYRARAGLTQARLAEKLGVHRNTVIAWERGRRPPGSRNMVLDLTDALELDEADTDRLLFALNYVLEHQTPQRDLQRSPRMDAQLAAIQEKLDRVESGVRKILERDGQRHIIPLQRPLRPEHFTGRDEPLAWLLTQLQPGRRVTLCGPGGIGKTALAAEAIWTLAPGDDPPASFPDGILFHTFYHQPQANLALEAIARVYGEELRPNPAEAARRALAGRRALLVLDGAENADDLDSVLEVAGSCGVLITTRRHADAPAGWLDVLPLQQDAAVRLLQAWGGDCAADSASAQRVAELLGGLPLALFLTGRYLAQRRQRAADYLVWLEGTPLAALHFDDRPSRSIPLLMAYSLARVSTNARAAFGVAGLLALAPFDCDPVSAALDVPANEADRALGELVNYGTLVRPGAAYRVTHALAHTYARQELTPAGETLTRLAEYYHAFIESESARGVAGYAWLDAAREHILAVQGACVAAGQWLAAQSLTRSAEDYLDLQGHWTARVALLEAGVAAARSAGNRNNESVFLGRLGLAYADLGEVRRAIEYHEQALAISREVGDQNAEGAHLGNLGAAYYRLGEAGQAIGYYEAALAISRKIGDRRREGAHLGNLGIMYRNLGEVQRAIGYYEEALPISQEIEDRRAEGAHRSNLGIAYKNLGKIRRAIEYYEDALAISREIGDRRAEGAVLGNLGNAYYSLGEVQRAIEFQEAALAIDREIGDRRGEGSDLGNLGRAYAELGDSERAVALCQQSLAIKRETGDRPGEGWALNYLGYAYFVAGDLTRAWQLHEEAIRILRETDYKQPLGRALIDLAEAHLAIGDLDRAEGSCREALAVAQEIGDRRGEALALRDLGLVLKQRGEISEAWESWKTALRIFEEIESPHAMTVRSWLATETAGEGAGTKV